MTVDAGSSYGRAPTDKVAAAEQAPSEYARFARNKALMYRNSLPSAKTKHGRDIGRRAKRGPLFGKEQLRYLGTPKHGLT